MEHSSNANVPPPLNSPPTQYFYLSPTRTQTHQKIPTVLLYKVENTHESPPCHSVQMLIVALGLDVNVIDGKAFLRADLRPQFLKVQFTVAPRVEFVF